MANVNESPGAARSKSCHKAVRLKYFLRLKRTRTSADVSVPRLAGFSLIT